MCRGNQTDVLGVERRKESRETARQPAVLTVLGGEAQPIDVFIDNRSNSGVAIRTPKALPLSAPVRVDTGDHMLLGEVCHCAPSGDGFLVGLRVEHVVDHIQALIQLHRALDGNTETRQTDRRDMLHSE